MSFDLPKGLASILWKDGSCAKEAAGLMKITAQELYELGVIEKVIAETNEEAFLPKEQLMEQMKAAISTKVAELSTLQTEELLEARYQRFRRLQKLGYPL